MTRWLSLMILLAACGHEPEELAAEYCVLDAACGYSELVPCVEGQLRAHEQATQRGCRRESMERLGCLAAVDSCSELDDRWLADPFVCDPEAARLDLCLAGLSH